MQKMSDSFHESETLTKYQIGLITTRRKEGSSVRPDPRFEVEEMEYKPTHANSRDVIYQHILIILLRCGHFKETSG